LQTWLLLVINVGRRTMPCLVGLLRSELPWQHDLLHFKHAVWRLQQGVHVVATPFSSALQQTARETDCALKLHWCGTCGGVICD
jgi:hypothetical protein